MHELSTSVLNVTLLLVGALVFGAAGMRARRRLAGSWWRVAIDGMVLAASALALAGVVAEIAALAVFDVPVLVVHSQFAEYQPGRFAPRPDHHWASRTQPGWHRWEVRTNEDGLRTDLPRLPARLPPNEIRVLFFGDSFTFGIGLNAHETYPAQVETLLREQDPTYHWVALNAGIPGANVLTIVEWFSWVAERYHPQIAVFTVGEADDVLPDLNTELRRRDGNSRPSLTRFALYRMSRKGLAWLRYLNARALQDRIEGGELPLRREEQRADLAESATLMAQTAQRLSCVIVFNRLLWKSDSDPAGSPAGGAIAAKPEPTSLLYPYAETGARFVDTVWDPGDENLTIPQDGHPSPAGAKLLARAVVPAIRAIVAQGLYGVSRLADTQPPTGIQRMGREARE